MDDLTGFRSPARWVGHPTVVLGEVSSTNDLARTHAEQGAPAGLMVVADAQTQGRGRRGRTWISPPGDNLYASLVLRPRMELSRIPSLALAVGLAVRDAVATFVGDSDATVKWPNDVRVRGRKVSGVLVEGSIRGAGLAYAIVGIGVNVRGEALPEDLAAIATTLRRETGRTIARAEVLGALCRTLEARLATFETHGFAALRDELRRRCDTLGCTVTVEGVTGLADDIADDGALVLRTSDGARVECRVGDVT